MPAVLDFKTLLLLPVLPSPESLGNLDLDFNGKQGYIQVIFILKIRSLMVYVKYCIL